MPATVTILAPLQGDTVYQGNAEVSVSYAGASPEADYLDCYIEAKQDTQEIVPAASGLHGPSKVDQPPLGYQQLTVKLNGDTVATEPEIFVSNLPPVTISPPTYPLVRTANTLRVTGTALKGARVAYVVVQVFEVNAATSNFCALAANVAVPVDDRWTVEFQLELSKETTIQYAVRVTAYDKNQRRIASASTVVKK